METNIDLHAYRYHANNSMGKYKLHLGMCFFINVTIDFLPSIFGPQTNESNKIQNVILYVFLKFL